MNNDLSNGRTLAAILSEMKTELQEFVLTRIELFQSELKEKAATLKSAIPLALIGALFLSTAFVIFSFALVALVAAEFEDNSYRFFFGALAVCILWSICGGFALYTVKRRLSKQGMVPQKTIDVLSGDKVWLQDETRNAL